ncbi:EAL domain-containing protein [Actinoplanes sp. NPDC049118]|uniref:putative bifunctional diguanylate cyclase/phosphodiesterase n=1 Tax=Actinoplanes sp. NPDC049118 TaxID=3155769 RepID=UPI0034038399
MSRLVRMGLRRDRLAFAGMATILLLLTLFAVSTAWRTSSNAASAARAGEIEGKYCDAGDALAVEQIRLREYRISPGTVNLRIYAGATARFEAALDDIASAAEPRDRAIVAAVREQHDAYLRSAAEVVAAAQGQPSTSASEGLDLALQDMSESLGDAEDDWSDVSAEHVDDLRASEDFLLWGTPVVFGVGLFLLALLVRLLRGYQRALQHQAGHDRLTGLPNRAEFGRRMSAALDRAAASGEQVAVLLLDLDRFKEINDTLGYQIGDQLLVSVATRLRAAIRDSDTFARLGGDEFAVLITQAGEENPEAVAQQIMDSLREPVVVDGMTLVAEATIGIAQYPRDGVNTAGELLQRADLAMHSAKGAGTGIASYLPSMDKTDTRKLSRLPELRRALDENELVMHYQPLVDVGDGRLHGAEALVRWQHPSEGLLGPGEFVPLAESTGLIHDMTRHVLRLAVDQAGQWHRAGEAVPISVNISTRCLLDVALPETVEEVLASAGLPASLLTLEITESAIMADPQRSREVLSRLEALGTRIAIDDFGTGYTSLAYLRDLPIHELKIDRTFVSRMVSESKDAIIVHTAIDLAHRLGLTTVAEGVEDQHTMTALAELDCDLVQGYLISRPMAAAQFQDWLDARHNALAV